MTIPTKSYRIWFTQRNGSTLLCRGLESTGVAGRPGEFFNVMESSSLSEKYRVEGYAQLRAKIWEMGTTKNGVFGIKHSMHMGRYNQVFDEILSLQNIEKIPNINHQEIWHDLFPNCQHIYLTRRNKVRQAVSWWKAIKDEVWHLETEQSHENEKDFYDKNYDFDALTHLFKEAVLRECAIQAYFSKYHITPLTLVYEDFIQDFDSTIKTIVDYLEIEYDELKAGEFFYRKTSNEYSEAWVQRFRKELQAKMNPQIW